MTIDKTVGCKIKYLRRKKHITQADLGKAVFDKSESACQNTIKNIETGRRNAKPEELKEILEELDVTDSEFQHLHVTEEPELVLCSETQRLPHKMFPEIDYYYNLYDQATEAGDEYMKLQIYKAMANKIGEKIKVQEKIEKESRLNGMAEA